MTKARTLADNYAADINQVTADAPLTGGGTSGTVTVGIQDGTTSQKGAVQLEDSTASTSTTKASTPNSVKSAYDLANGAIAKSIVDAKGDLIVATGSDTVARLAVASTAGYLLSVDSAETTGLKWAAPAAASFVGCRVHGSGTQSISNTTETALTWDSETFDTDGFHSTSTNTDRITIPSGKGGYYLVQGVACWESDDTGKRDVYLIKTSGGTNTQFALASMYAGEDGGLLASGIANLAAGDYVTMKVYQNSGGSKNVQKLSAFSYFAVTYLGA